MSPVRDNRITTKRGFEKVLKARKSVTSKYLIVNYLHVIGPSCLGLSIAKKMTRTNVQRNNVRRRISEAFRLSITNQTNLQVVARLKRSCLDLKSARVVAKEFTSLFEKINKPTS